MDSCMHARFGCRLVVLTLLATAGTSQTKLNGPLPRQLVGRPVDFRYSPDSATVVYLSDGRTDEVFELFSVPADGSSAPIVLSASLVAGGDVNSGFEIAPDSSTVYYLADAATDELVALYGAPIDGSGPPFVLGTPQISGGDVRSFALSPDGATIVFLADALMDERLELYRVPADGSSAPALLSPIVPAGGDVASYSIGATSSRVYYLADAMVDERMELFSRPLDASAPAVQLNAPLSSLLDVTAYRVDAAESRVTFRADGVTDEVYELFSVPVDRSSAPVKLNPALVAGGDVTSSFEVSPDGSRVAYKADQSLNDAIGLYSVRTDGSGSSVQLSGPIVGSFLFTPNSAKVVYTAQNGSNIVILAVPSTGGAPITLQSRLASEAEFHLLMVSPDSSTCLYIHDVLYRNSGDDLVGNNPNLWVAPLAGGAPKQLTLEPYHYTFSQGFHDVMALPDWSRLIYTVEGASAPRLASVRTNGSEAPLTLDAASSFRTSPDGLRVAFIPEFMPEAGRLVSVAPLGGVTTVLSPPPLEGELIGAVTSFEPTPDGLQALYTVSPTGDFLVTGVGGTGSPRSLLPTLTDWRLETLEYTLSPSSDGVAFTLDSRFDGQNELFWAPLRSRGTPVSIGGAVGSGLPVSTTPGLQPIFTPDGTQVLFARDLVPGGSYANYALFLSPRDGDSPPTRLNGTTTDSILWDGDEGSPFTVYEERAFAPTPDGTRVVYSARPAIFGIVNLFSVPLDGSSAPVQLSQLSVSFTSVDGNWGISPDGNRVVYLAEEQQVQRPELFSVPVDGSSPRIKLNPTLRTGGHVGYPTPNGFFPHVRLTPDGRAVYWAVQEVTVGEIYSVPIDGSATAIKLSGTLVPGGEVSNHFVLTPDGSRVVYIAQAHTDGVNELFIAPVDGSAAPLKLNGPLVTGGDVVSVISRAGPVRFGGNRAVYLADALVDAKYELFSAPLDGSGPAVLLSGPLVAGGDVWNSEFAVTPDETTVIFRADALVDESFELFRAPIDGSAPPLRLNLPMAPRGDVQVNARVLSTGRRVLWVADQAADMHEELFSLELAPRTPKYPALPPGISGTVTRQL